MPKKLFFWLILLALPATLIFTQCHRTENNADPRGAEYAGSKTCESCHKDIYHSYLHTAHFAALLPASVSSIHGKFIHNKFDFKYNSYTKVVMEKTDSGYYQSNFINGEKQQSQRMDLSFGDVKGESYAYWKGNELFELPVSYDNKLHSWVISPGYDSTFANYNRMVGRDCLECHGSFAKSEPPSEPVFSGKAEGFDKSSIVMGVDCERCHGPAKQHVDFQLAHPENKTANYITKIGSLTRKQQNDLCSTCHAGTKTVSLKSIFLFKPGDTFEEYRKLTSSSTPLDYTHIDVHGNQRALLESSRCFTASTTLNCNTCHDTHQVQRNLQATFADKCQSCHTAEKHNFCNLAGQLSMAVLRDNCVSCHMPAQPTKTIVTSSRPGEEVLIHTHHIAVYPVETARIMAYLKSGIINKPEAKLTP